jgi:hypothetical protein
MKDRTRKLLVSFGLVTMGLVGMGSPLAASTFSADLTVNLLFPAPFPGLVIAPRGMGDAVLPPCVGVAVAPGGVNPCNGPTDAFNAGTNTLTFTVGQIAGFANLPTGSAFAVSSGTSERVDVFNATANVLMVNFGGTYNYHLATTAVAPEFAFAFEMFDISANGVVVFGPKMNQIASPPNATAPIPPGPFPIGFILALPAMSDTVMRIDPIVSGGANVPEPATVLLLVSGLCVLKISKAMLKRS